MRVRRSAFDAPERCSRSTSSIACSALWRGSRLEYGSWKTICTSPPRRRRSLAERDGVERSRPQAVIVPAVGAVRPTSMRATVVLPEPDSPTIASEPPCGDLEIDAVDGHDVAELLAQPGGREDGLRHGAADLQAPLEELGRAEAAHQAAVERLDRRARDAAACPRRGRSAGRTGSRPAPRTR